ncbi:ABC transporter A family member 2 [Selaginella moellendorffii]|uniref:ABC transporter A family member 2 n=1 Tax=Selaginella moellendorffii TaxID=88036 RepID=UPI000D1C95A5|nr:ABC transporter A family member 2 [Selaginella moellendorffii]|eukprot:XP_024514873.1 ABC transporter A family member 2 [Selaginella moellendorffii]
MEEGGDGGDAMASGKGLKTGCGLFAQQFKALMLKNLKVSMRNKRAFFLQVASSFGFIFLLFVVDQAAMASRRSDAYYRDVVAANPKLVAAIPACESSAFIRPPCYDFLWSDSSNPDFAAIVEKIMANNPGRPIPSHKVRGFGSSSEVDSWLLSNPMACSGALHLEQSSAGVISYGLQFNSTPSGVLLRGKHENAPFNFQLPLQAAVEREITRFLTGKDIEWNVWFSEYPHPDLGRFSSVGSFGPTFLFASTMFSVVILISKIVYEKELKLRQAMSTMGLFDSVYWLTWLTWEVMLALSSSAFLIISGMIFRLNFFLNNSLLILFLIFFLFQFNMIGFAFLFSTFVTKLETSNSMGFCIFIFGSLTQLVTTMGFPYDPRYPSYIKTLWSFFPPNVFAIGLMYLGEGTATKRDRGLLWKDVSSCPPFHVDCNIVMAEVFVWLFGTFFIWFFLAIYFDNVLPDANGLRKSLYYFVRPSYWAGRSRCKRAERDGTVDPNVAVQLRNLTKVFPGVRSRGHWKKSPPFHALQGVSLDIEKEKVFCLLGHNGAGKTTIINILTGILPLTSGDALVYGMSVTNGMAQIRHSMGVCPQFNILWDALTAIEHLQIFASIKGMQPSRRKTECKRLLLSSDLLESSRGRVSAYSEGMKRRLSVAIALIGDPKIVFLDEPTTGMDPISRRKVWEIIEKLKTDRAIVLTTHSMEEADNLGDSIAIVANGTLRCVGSSIQLKQQFGEGYIVTCSVKSTDNKAAVKDFFKLYMDVVAKEETRSYMSFILPRRDENLLAVFFELLQKKQEELGILDIQLSLSTLEEVFLNILEGTGQSCNSELKD